MATDDIAGFFEWIIGFLYLIGVGIMRIIFVKTNKLEDALGAHILHTEQTYAKTADMNVGLNAATKLAESISQTLNTKMDKTQESVQKIAVEQARQGANIENMGKNIVTIAESIKDKSAA